MSGILGIWNLDGHSVDSALPRRMIDSIAYRGLDMMKRREFQIWKSEVRE